MSIVDNLSVNKGATQSTTFTNNITDDRYKAGNAVDGNIMTCTRTEQIGPTSPDQTVWWMVDLGEVYNIYSVNILFKNYDGYGTVICLYILQYRKLSDVCTEV